MTFPKLWVLVNAVMGKFEQNQGKERTGWEKKNAERRKSRTPRTDFVCWLPAAPGSRAMGETGVRLRRPERD